MPDIAALRSALADAEDEANRVLLADDFALTNGAYARAMNVVHACRLEVMAAEVSATCAAIGADLSEIAAAAGVATACTDEGR